MFVGVMCLFVCCGLLMLCDVVFEVGNRATAETCERDHVRAATFVSQRRAEAVCCCSCWSAWFCAILITRMITNIKNAIIPVSLLKLNG